MPLTQTPNPMQKNTMQLATPQSKIHQTYSPIFSHRQQSQAANYQAASQPTDASQVQQKTAPKGHSLVPLGPETIPKSCRPTLIYPLTRGLMHGDTRSGAKNLVPLVCNEPRAFRHQLECIGVGDTGFEPVTSAV